LKKTLRVLKKKVFLRGRKPGVTLLCVECDLCLFVALSRSYTAAAAAAEMKLQTKLVTENQAEAGQEEVIGECQLQHGEILNGDIKIHYVECGKLDGDLVRYTAHIHLLLFLSFFPSPFCLSSF
jgi:hypothetical protein